MFVECPKTRIAFWRGKRPAVSVELGRIHIVCCPPYVFFFVSMPFRACGRPQPRCDWFGRVWCIIPWKNIDERTRDGKKNVSTLCMFFALWLQFPVPKAPFKLFLFFGSINGNKSRPTVGTSDALRESKLPCEQKIRPRAFFWHLALPRRFILLLRPSSIFFRRNCALVGLVLPKFGLGGSAIGADLTTNQTKYLKFEYTFISTSCTAYDVCSWPSCFLVQFSKRECVRHALTWEDL